MMVFYLGGVITGCVLWIFFYEAFKTSKENELYMEGYNAGKADKLEYEIDVLRARHSKCVHELTEEFLAEAEHAIAFYTGRAEAYRECVELLEGKQ